MNKCIKKTMFFALLLSNIPAVAMNAPVISQKYIQPDEGQEILSTVIALLDTGGMNAAIMYLRENGDVNNKYLRILEDKTKSREADRIEHTAWLAYKKASLTSLDISLDIERLVLLLNKNLSILSNACDTEFITELIKNIKKLLRLQSQFANRRPYKEIQQIVIAEAYAEWLINENANMHEEYCFKAPKDWRLLEDVINDILNNVERALATYCEEVYFNVHVQCPMKSALAYLPRNYIDDYQLNNTILEDFVADRRAINVKIMNILNGSRLSNDEFVQVEKVVKLTVAFLEKYTRDLAQQNPDILKRVRRQIFSLANDCSRNPLPSSSAKSSGENFGREETQASSGDISSNNEGGSFSERSSIDERQENAISIFSIGLGLASDPIPSDHYYRGYEKKPERENHISAHSSISAMDQINMIVKNLEEADERRNAKAPKSSPVKKLISRMSKRSSGSSSHSPKD